MTGDHERIWLEHPDAADPYNGRMWCEDKVWPESEGDGEPTEYVRADLYRAKEERITALEAERDAALEGPWPKWANELRKYLMSFGVDPGDEWDLPEQYEMWMNGVVEAETARAEAAEAKLTKAVEALTDIEKLSEDGTAAKMIARATLKEIGGGGED